MMTTMKNSLIREDSLPNIEPVRVSTPLKSSFSTVSPDLPDILSSAVLHKRRTQKRVRFALKLEPVEEDSLPSSRPLSASPMSKSNRRVIDPWRQGGPLYGAYVEYLEKHDALTTPEKRSRRTPPPPPPAPEPGAEPPTYTHTFVIQSKSPEIVIDSITVSTPPLHLPRIIHRTKGTNKHQLPAVDSYVKQQLTLSTSPRMIHTKRTSNSPTHKNYYSSVHAALKRAELNIPTPTGLHPNNKTLRPDNSSGLKSINDPIPTKKMTEIISKPLPGLNNQINHFYERPTLPNYTKKPRTHNRTYRNTDETTTNTPYFFQNYDNDYLLPPIIHSTH